MADARPGPPIGTAMLLVLAVVLYAGMMGSLSGAADSDAAGRGMAAHRQRRDRSPMACDPETRGSRPVTAHSTNESSSAELGANICFDQMSLALPRGIEPLFQP